MRNPCKVEEILTSLQRANASTESVMEYCQRKAISGKMLCRWRKQYGELHVNEAKRLKALEAKNAKLKKLLLKRCSPMKG